MKLRETWDDRYGLLNHPYLHYGVVAVTATPWNAGVDGGEAVILVDTGGFLFTVNLPPASANPGKAFIIKKTDAAAVAVKIQPQAGDTIDGAASNSTIAAQYDTLQVVSDGGTGWWIIGEAGPSF
jgi:hypothetical protein